MNVTPSDSFASGCPRLWSYPPTARGPSLPVPTGPVIFPAGPPQASTIASCDGRCPPPSLQRRARIVAIVAGLSFAAFGLWAFVDARSFYDELAAFPPSNRHLLHDIGAFQIGIGSMLLLSSFWRDALGAALTGAAVGAAFHFAAHLWDRDIGGKDTDPLVFGAVALVLIVSAVAQRTRRAEA